VRHTFVVLLFNYQEVLMAAQELLRLEKFLRKITQAQISRATGLSQPTLSRIERGLRPVTPDEQLAIARVLGVPAADLFPGQDGDREG
jgi:transcriptional regulator with XRE-family HTH domain